MRYYELRWPHRCIAVGLCATLPDFRRLQGAGLHQQQRRRGGQLHLHALIEPQDLHATELLLTWSEQCKTKFSSHKQVHITRANC